MTQSSRGPQEPGEGMRRWMADHRSFDHSHRFFFPFHGLTLAFKLGMITVPILAITIYARYSKQLAGAWR